MPNPFHCYPPMPPLVFMAAGEISSALHHALHRANTIAPQVRLLPDHEGNFQLEGHLPARFERVLNPEANRFRITANSTGEIFEISEVCDSTADGFFGAGIPVDTLVTLLHLWVEQQTLCPCTTTCTPRCDSAPFLRNTPCTDDAPSTTSPYKHPPCEACSPSPTGAGFAFQVLWL